MVAVKSVVAIVIVACVQILACGKMDPAVQNGDGGDTSQREENDYYPMGVGDYWVYEEKDVYNNVETLRYEVIGIETIDFGYETGEREVFVVENTLPEKPGESRIQYIEDDGVRTVRHRHLVYDKEGKLTKERNFVPGFLRFDRSQVRQGDSWTEEVKKYTDALDGLGVQSQNAKYQYEVMGVNEPMAVGAGTFNSIRIRRSELFGNEIKEYYFGYGVGKIKEMTEGVKTETLVEYHLAPKQ